jgi:hypothetical protein
MLLLVGRTLGKIPYFNSMGKKLTVLARKKERQEERNISKMVSM